MTAAADIAATLPTMRLRPDGSERRLAGAMVGTEVWPK